MVVQTISSLQSLAEVCVTWTTIPNVQAQNTLSSKQKWVLSSLIRVKSTLRWLHAQTAFFYDELQLVSYPYSHCSLNFSHGKNKVVSKRESTFLLLHILISVNSKNSRFDITAYTLSELCAENRLWRNQDKSTNLLFSLLMAI